MKTCSKCGASKPNADYKRADLTRDYTDCRACRHERRLELAKAKLALPVRNGTSPFDWRNYQQPVPMKAGKWEQEPRPEQKVNARFTQYT